MSGGLRFTFLLCNLIPEMQKNGSEVLIGKLPHVGKFFPYLRNRIVHSKKRQHTGNGDSGSPHYRLSAENLWILLDKSCHGSALTVVENRFFVNAKMMNLGIVFPFLPSYIFLCWKLASERDATNQFFAFLRDCTQCEGKYTKLRARCASNYSEAHARGFICRLTCRLHSNRLLCYPLHVQKLILNPYYYSVKLLKKVSRHTY